MRCAGGCRCSPASARATRPKPCDLARDAERAGAERHRRLPDAGVRGRAAAAGRAVRVPPRDRRRGAAADGAVPAPAGARGRAVLARDAAAADRDPERRRHQGGVVRRGEVRRDAPRARRGAAADHSSSPATTTSSWSRSSSAREGALIGFGTIALAEQIEMFRLVAAGDIEGAQRASTTPSSSRWPTRCSRRRCATTARG